MRDDGLFRFCAKTLWGHSEWVRSVVPSDDGRWLVSASRDHVSPSNPPRIALQQMLIAASMVQNSHVWDYSAGTSKVELRGHENDVECAEFAPIVAYAAIRELTGKTVSLYLAADLAIFKAHGRDVVQAPAGDPRSKSPGCFVATGSRDKTVRLWDAQTGQCLKVFVSMMTISPSDLH